MFFGRSIDKLKKQTSENLNKSWFFYLVALIEKTFRSVIYFGVVCRLDNELSKFRTSENSHQLHHEEIEVDRRAG